MPRSLLIHACLLVLLTPAAALAQWGLRAAPPAEPEPELPPAASQVLAEELEAATAAEPVVEDEEPAAIAPIFLSNSDDPYVMLDEAKLSIGDGKLRRASEMLAVIDPAGAEDFVAEELLFQRLLLAGAFLNSAGSVLKDAQNAGYADSAYAAWLHAEGERYARDYSALAGQYLAATADGLACDFVRFRLPRVTADHLSDAVLYSDPQVLRAAVQNWDEAKTGLGKGLIGTQARVALVLGAATFYDMPHGAATLEGASMRLRNGVPLDERAVLDWLAQTAYDQQAVGGGGLREVRDAADARLEPLLRTPGSVLRQRYDRRNAPAGS